MASTSKGVFSIDTFPVEARRRLAIVDVRFAGQAGKTWWTFASVTRYGVLAYAAVSTRVGNAVVYVDLTSGTGETRGAGTLEGVDEIVTNSTVQTGLILAFVYVDFALGSSET